MGIDRFFIKIIILLGVLSTSTIFGLAVYSTYMEFAICIIGVCFLVVSKTIVRDTFYYIAWGVFVVAVNGILYPSSFLYGIKMIILISAFIFAFYYAQLREIDVLSIFFKIVFVLSIISLIIYFAVEVLNIPIPYSLFSKDWTHTYKNYFYIYVARDDGLYDSILGINFVRNCGFFTEPGMFCVFLDICLFVNLYYKKCTDRWKTICLITAIITTSSTTGIIVMFVLVFAYIIVNNKKLSRNTAAICFLIALGVVGVIAKDMLDTKLLNHAHSYNSRLFDLIGGLELFIKKPIWGWGLRNTEIFYQLQTGMFIGVRPNSNGVMTILYQLGIAGVVFYLLPYILFCKNRIKENIDSKISCVVLGSMLVLLLASQPFEYMSLGAAILAFLLVESNRERESTDG